MYNQCCGQDPYFCCCRRRRYGVGTGVVDLALIIFTGGLWLVWMVVRFLRTNISPRW